MHVNPDFIDPMFELQHRTLTPNAELGIPPFPWNGSERNDGGALNSPGADAAAVFQSKGVATRDAGLDGFHDQAGVEISELARVQRQIGLQRPVGIVRHHAPQVREGRPADGKRLGGILQNLEQEIAGIVLRRIPGARRVVAARLEIARFPMALQDGTGKGTEVLRVIDSHFPRDAAFLVLVICHGHGELVEAGTGKSCGRQAPGGSEIDVRRGRDRPGKVQGSSFGIETATGIQFQRLSYSKIQRFRGSVEVDNGRCVSALVNHEH